jgi:hypothetical protein
MAPVDRYVRPASPTNLPTSRNAHHRQHQNHHEPHTPILMCHHQKVGMRMNQIPKVSALVLPPCASSNSCCFPWHVEASSSRSRPKTKADANKHPWRFLASAYSLTGSPAIRRATLYSVIRGRTYSAGNELVEGSCDTLIGCNQQPKKEDRQILNILSTWWRD